MFNHRVSLFRQVLHLDFQLNLLLSQLFILLIHHSTFLLQFIDLVSVSLKLQFLQLQSVAILFYALISVAHCGFEIGVFGVHSAVLSFKTRKFLQKTLIFGDYLIVFKKRIVLFICLVLFLVAVIISRQLKILLIRDQLLKCGNFLIFAGELLLTESDLLVSVLNFHLHLLHIIILQRNKIAAFFFAHRLFFEFLLCASQLYFQL